MILKNDGKHAFFKKRREGTIYPKLKGSTCQRETVKAQRHIKLKIDGLWGIFLKLLQKQRQHVKLLYFFTVHCPSRRASLLVARVHKTNTCLSSLNTLYTEAHRLHRSTDGDLFPQRAGISLIMSPLSLVITTFSNINRPQLSLALFTALFDVCKVDPNYRKQISESVNCCILIAALTRAPCTVDHRL